MLRRLALAAALICVPLAALAQSQGIGVRLTDDYGNTVGNIVNPLRMSGVPSAAAGGLSVFSRIPSSTASTNLTTAKASAGRAYVFQGCNTTASTIYLRIYNAATTGAVTVGATVPFAGPYAFPANTCIQPTNFASDIGVSASTGITYAFGTAPADTDTTAIGAGAITGFQLGFQ